MAKFKRFKLLAVHLVFNSYFGDSRVVRETQFISSHLGWKVLVLGLKTDAPLQTEQQNAQANSRSNSNPNLKVKLINLQSKNLPPKIPFQLIKYIEFFFKSLPDLLRAQVLHCHDLSPLPIAILIKILKLGRLRIVYDSHELQSETLYTKSKAKKFLVRSLELACNPLVNEIIAVSPLIAEYYQARLNKSVHILYNCPNTEFNKKSDLSDLTQQNVLLDKFPQLRNKLVFISIGLLTHGRGIFQVLKAFAKLSNKSLALVVIGNGPLAKEVEAFSQKHEQIFYHPAVPPESIISYVQAADVGIVSVENLCLSYDYCLPNKFFEYIFSGLPVLSSDLKQLSQIVKKYNCGEVYKPTDDGLSQAIIQMAEADLSQYQQGIRRLQKDFNWQKCQDVLKKIYPPITKNA